MSDGNYIFTADLIAFVEKQDLPPSLRPFLKSASWRDRIKVERDTRHIILRIREAPDACHAVIVNNGMGLEEIEDRIQKDLEVVRLSEETRTILKGLLERFRRGEFTYFLSREASKVRHGYKY
jgi:hypothetical protein